MYKEFEGATEQAAIEKASEALGIDNSQFDVEVVESMNGGLFKKGRVKIRVYPLPGTTFSETPAVTKETQGSVTQENGYDQCFLDFINGIVSHMGYEGHFHIKEKTGKKILLDFSDGDSSRLIGKQGKTLDALQVLMNSYAATVLSKNDEKSSLRVVIDIEDYRSKRQDRLADIAKKASQDVIKNRSSILLEPMNPFERRIIHMTLNDNESVTTMSEGDGVFKQVRVIYKGANI